MREAGRILPWALSSIYGFDLLVLYSKFILIILTLLNQWLLNFVF